MDKGVSYGDPEEENFGYDVIVRWVGKDFEQSGSLADKGDRLSDSRNIGVLPLIHHPVAPSHCTLLLPPLLAYDVP
jgi:hypothetical protein